MLFNSMIREKSYHILHTLIPKQEIKLQVLHGCRQLVPVRRPVNSKKLTQTSM